MKITMRLPFGYPSAHLSASTLEQIALGDQDVCAEERAGNHLADCVTCQTHVASIRRIQRLLQEAPQLDADEALLVLIQRRRASGERIELPQLSAIEHAGESTTHRRSRFTKATGVVLAAAAAVALLATQFWSDQPSGATSTPASIASRPVAATEETNVFSLWPSLAYAAESPQTEAPYEPAAGIDSARSLAGSRLYVRSSASAYRDEKLPISSTIVEVTSVSLDDIPAWLVVTSNPFDYQRFKREPDLIQHDSVWLQRSDLRILRRHFRSHVSDVMQRLRADTLLQEDTRILLPPGVKVKLNAEQLRRTRQYIVRSGTRLITDQSSMMLLVRSLRLHSRWRGSVDVQFVGGAPRGLYYKTRALNMSVQGDSVVSTIWARVPCWRVMLHTGATPEKWYVSKEGHEVLLIDGPDGMNWPRSRLDLLGRFVR